VSGGLPSPDNLLLLRAALADGDEATGSWAEWTAGVGLDRADHASQRLLPLVFSNLRRLGVDEPELPRLRGIYRHAWYRNQLLFRTAGEVIGRFREAGIATLALKGIALSLLHYRDAGLRPMGDIDLLVKPAQADEAVALVERNGWRPLEPVPTFLEVKHAHPFVDDGRRQLDLHWNALWEAAPDDDLWADAVPIEVQGEATLALDPTDQLLHVCVHGVQWDPTPSIRWVADAVTVLRTAPIDWDRLVARARARRLTVGLSVSLAYLREELAAPVPAGVVAELGAASAHVHERLGHRAKAWHGGLTRRLVLNWDRHRRLAVLYPEYSRIGFPEFVLQFAGVDSYRRLPRAAVGYSVEHWRRRLARQ
jgi:hypothetical protein